MEEFGGEDDEFSFQCVGECESLSHTLEISRVISNMTHIVPNMSSSTLCARVNQPTELRYLILLQFSRTGCQVHETYLLGNKHSF